MSEGACDWILKGQAELQTTRQQTLGDTLIGSPDLRPGSREFLDALDELRDLHLRKTRDYGTDEDALANIRNSADVVNISPLAACVVRMADKMQRLRAFFHNGRVEFDGLVDTLDDLACYAQIAKVFYREQGPQAVKNQPDAA